MNIKQDSPLFRETPVVDQKHFGDRYGLLFLESSDIAASLRPGNFLFVYLDGGETFYLPRPFSPFSVEGGVVTILYQVVGRGTREMKKLRAGDRVRLLGPLGKPFPLRANAEGLLLLAGGMGIAPLNMLAHDLPVDGTGKRRTVILYGASHAETLVGIPYLESSGHILHVATDDGSRGEKGTVLQLLESHFGDDVKALQNWQLVAAGPRPMLKALSRWGEKRGLSIDFYMEERMACGVGACLGCVVERRTGTGVDAGVRDSGNGHSSNREERYVSICREGPVFSSGSVLVTSAGSGEAEAVSGIGRGASGITATADAASGSGPIATARAEKDAALAEPADLTATIGPLMLSGPLIAASGTFGCGEEYRELVDYGNLGAIVTKAVSFDPMVGNPPPRIAEVRGGMLNSIGLQNRGVEYFMREKVPAFRDLETRVIVNVAGRDEKEYVDVVRRLDGIAGIDAFEINISCPNVKKGGMLFGSDPDVAFRVLSAVRKATSLPVVAKLTPNVTNPGAVARAVEDAGCDAISLINTIRGMGVDLKTREPLLATVTGGLSGPAIKPTALANLWIVRHATSLPIIGGGGIMNGDDALEFIVTGASAVQIGTVFFVNPEAPGEILMRIGEYMKECGCDSLRVLVGSLRNGR